ncbi:aminotransferase class V-fold PLP-dependent enzyme [Microbacterium rhizomatis]|uniref:Aminotransferase class V-fold PLP-dependent enzyme n=1 Tax=Microbacterium rhizomatis TaxID=1631477 RepID=A0A5J5J3R0_9MICO|nr:aminotransferase class V-fold PLP-dependent enzyme [Microbacterium rhizomatis]KAA9110632.1 aminotransferase class V-fold PLP-dependent enzyme [Microbacterium rhizomatis]
MDVADVVDERVLAESARAEFLGGRGYLAACTTGLPTRSTRRAVQNDLEAAAAGHPDVMAYSAAVESSRASFARLVGAEPERVAIGSQASVMAALVAGSLPDNAVVLCADGDFSSIVLPFVHAGRGIRVRTAPLAGLADAVTSDTDLVVFSLVQSATGEVADADAITASARRHGARTLCDATQAVGWLPVDARMFDAVVCHAYKWLCAPRGVAFLALAPDFAATLRPIFAGWYAGEDPWTSCYGHEVELAADARRFDLSPAWQAFIGAAPALRLFADLDPYALHAHATGLATGFREAMSLGTPDRPSAIVTWVDRDGCDLARLTAAGITASGRAGRARVAFHLFNDSTDVDLALRALGR